MNDAEKIQRVCEYINLHLDDDLNVAQLCQQVYLSKFHVHRLFTAITGMSMMAYVQQCRLKRASYQLAFQRESIIAIALQAGFDSHEAFSRAFKRRFHQTPTAFRQQPDWSLWQTQLQMIHPIIEVNMNIEIQQRSAENIAYLRHTGSPKRVLETATEFIAWRQSSGLSPLKTSHTYGIPHADPEQVPEEDFVFDIAGSVTEPVPANDFGVLNGQLPAGRYAVIHHEGSHDTINNSIYHLFRTWLPEQQEQAGDFPIVFHYHNFIHDVAEHELRTDVLLLLRD